MVNGDAILESLQAQMQESNKAFDAVNAEIEKTVEEANKKLEELSKRREQIRGEYTGLYNMYMKFKTPEAETNTEEVKSEPAKVVEMKPKAKAENKEEAKQAGTLTAEETAKLQQAMNKSKQPKEEDIPDYLKEDYKK